MDAMERCLPTEEILLKETKKFLAYQELYSWQENMGLYDCDATYLKSLAELTSCQVEPRTRRMISRITYRPPHVL
jgi:hypothetical protein